MEKLIDDITNYLKEKFNEEKNKHLIENGIEIELPDIKEFYTYEPTAPQKYPCIAIVGQRNNLDLRNISNNNGRVQYTNTYLVRIYIMQQNNSRGDILERQMYRYVDTIINLFSSIEAFYFGNSYKCMIKSPVSYLSPSAKNISAYFKMAVIDLEFENIC